MATTAGDIVRGALRLLQVASDDVTLSSDEMNDGLSALNDMIDSWANENLALYQVVRESFTLTAGKNPHTWGTGGDFNSARPVELLAASVAIGSSPTVDIPLQIISYDAYEAIALKGLVTNYPREVYINNAFPLASVYLYPVPNGATLNTQSYKPLTEFANLTTELSLPPGYRRTLRYNLAVELAPEYQVTAGPEVIAIASKSMTALKGTNYKATIARVDPALVRIGTQSGGRYNPYSDQRG